MTTLKGGRNISRKYQRLWRHIFNFWKFCQDWKKRCGSFRFIGRSWTRPTPINSTRKCHLAVIAVVFTVYQTGTGTWEAEGKNNYLMKNMFQTHSCNMQWKFGCVEKRKTSLYLLFLPMNNDHDCDNNDNGSSFSYLILE